VDEHVVEDANLLLAELVRFIEEKTRNVSQNFNSFFRRASPKSIFELVDERDSHVQHGQTCPHDGFTTEASGCRKERASRAL
jgi:hypothetical protein